MTPTYVHWYRQNVTELRTRAPVSTSYIPPFTVHPEVSVPTHVKVSAVVARVTDDLERGVEGRGGEGRG